MTRPAWDARNFGMNTAGSTLWCQGSQLYLQDPAYWNYWVARQLSLQKSAGSEVVPMLFFVDSCIQDRPIKPGYPADATCPDQMKLSCEKAELSSKHTKLPCALFYLRTSWRAM